jgi:phosphinothricin acetyltransferase
MTEREEVQVRPGTEAHLETLTSICNPYITETPITFDTGTFTPEERTPRLLSRSQDAPHRLLVAQEDPAGRIPGYYPTSRSPP